MTDLLERLRAAIAADDDHMNARGEYLTWLAAQLVFYPERVDPTRTMNDRFLRMSAAATMASMARDIERLRETLGWCHEQANDAMSISAGSATANGDPDGALEMLNRIASDIAVNAEIALTPQEKQDG